MEEKIVKICWFRPSDNRNLRLPNYETRDAAGMDVEAAVHKATIVEPAEIVLIPTNLAVALPTGYELQVRPRSGLAVKHGITLINGPGTIDADYRGEIKIVLINHGKKPFTVHRGDRIAQLILAPVTRARLRLVETLDTTERADGGFGHTGV